jgi:hypothetical protein
MQSNKTMTRRTALRRLVGSCAAALVPAVAHLTPRSAWAADLPANVAGAVIAREQNGAEIHQVTTERLRQSNIYCEIPYCSRDSRYFVYQRANPALDDNSTEFMVVELGTWKQHRLDVAASAGGCAMAPDGTFYYLKRVGNERAIMRADLAAGTSQEAFRRPGGPWVHSLGTVTSDGRYYAGGLKIERRQAALFGIILVDLVKGTENVIDHDPHIFNPHPQFEPGHGRWLMIQHDRNRTMGPGGKAPITSPDGATLYLLSVPDGKREPLRLGRPYTSPCTGHEAWIGATGEMLLSVVASGDFAPEKEGSLLAIRPGGAHRAVAGRYYYNHVGVSRCGRLYSTDDYRDDFKIVIGSPRTGRSAVVCASKTWPTHQQNTHPHAYLTPDLKWVIFNSTRSGWPHVYAARIPDEIVGGLLA